MNADIEQIVAEVIRRLMAVAGDGLSKGDGQSTNGKSPTSSLASIGGTSGMPISLGRQRGQGTAASEVLTSHERVLTLATLEGKFDGLRRLVVHRKAIVTPALREELSRRGVELDRGGENAMDRAGTAISVVRFDVERAPNLHPHVVEDVTVNSAISMAQTVAQHVEKNHRLVVVLTRQTTLALCALNRNRTVRAALVTNAESVRMAAQAIAANVLVVDPSHLGRVQIAALLRTFENEGVRQPPSQLSEAL